MQPETQAKFHTKSIVMAGWDDAPHLGTDEKNELLGSCEPHLRESRSKGIPNLGSGAIFPINVADIEIEGFQIKPWFKRCYGLDVGWKYTAAVWGALDPDTDVLYLYDCYKMEKAEPEIHAAAIKRRDVKNTNWVGAIDPASRSRGQADGKQLLRLYRQNGLKVVEADNAVESGLYAIWSRLSTGRLKIFKGVMSPWVEEYRMYRRDTRGRVVKSHDHLMDATRYMVMTGLKHAKPVTAQAPMNTASRNYGI